MTSYGSQELSDEAHSRGAFGMLDKPFEPLIRYALNDCLTSDGYRVVEAETAAQAIAKSREGVDLVLLDYRLPDGDGLSVLKRIKERDPDTLVILLTAHQSVELAVEAMKEGASHYANNIDGAADGTTTARGRRSHS